MSGICGIVNLDGAPVRPGVLQQMAEAAAHRGPDGIRYWRSGNVGFAHLALNITPESYNERQPLASDRARLILTADARVDNRNELVRTLRAKGYLQAEYAREETLTDADLIIAAYRCWGEACPEHIVGDFAFALWDASRQRLFASREPMGTRALYYRIEPRRVLFATEIKQILVVPGVPARIFDPAVGAFLAAGAGLPDWTFYQGIAQLPPAHALVADGSGTRTWRYWDIEPDFRLEYADEVEYAEHFVEVFKEAVRCRLRSTKPVGIFLSGGMDSGSVASTAGWLLEQSDTGTHPGFRAYCWAFEEHPQSDERHISDRIVRHYGFPVTYIPADTAWPLKDYPDHGPDRDEPYVATFRALNDLALATARAEGMGWIFTGGLGDVTVGEDVFDYLELLRKGKWWQLSGELRAHGRLWGIRRRDLVRSYVLAPLADFAWPSGLADRLRERTLDRMLRRSQRPYPAWVREEFAQRVGLTDIIRQSIPRPPMSDFARRRRYQTIFSPTNTQDVASWERSNSRFGLGDVDPFSDRRVISFVLAVPQRVLARAGESKLLLRHSMRGIMPEEARLTAGKILPTPLLDTAVHRHAKETVLDLITEPIAETRGYIDARVLADEMAAMWRGEYRRPYYWFTLSLEMWLRQYWS